MARRDLTFRVFVSSTFSDLKAERNALQENTFPRLRAYCQEKGARFQAIDLRWGVSEEAALDQQTMNICIQELKRCQVVSPRPNFIILLGERYGWRPLPPQIEASEFETLLEYVAAHQRPLLLKWYKRDDNAVPPEYCLQPRKVDITDAQTDQEKQAVHDAEVRRWSEQAEPLLGSLLASAAREVFPDSEDPRRQKYEDSATHQEIRYGAFKAEDPQSHVFAYFRTIEELPEDDRAKDFLDIKNGTIDKDANSRLRALKSELRSLLPPEHVYEYTAQWHDGQPQSDLQALCDRVESDLRQIIDSELAAFQQASELEREIKAHQEFGQQRAEHFVGRQEILERIQAYLVGQSIGPLAVHGVSGSGKTALVARAIQMTKEASPDADSIFRFIGATPSSSDGRSLLESLCRQIYEMFSFEEQKSNLLAQVKDTSAEAQEKRQRIEEEYSVPSEYQKLSPTFRDFLTKIPKARKLLLFLDALDQLSDTDRARNLSWLPDKLPENVRLIVSCLPGECLAVVQKRIPQQNIIELKPMPPEEGEKLLDIWLNDAGRTLQAHQRSEVLGKFQQCGLPLYLKLAFEEARLWKSYTEKVELSPDVPGIIRDLFRRLSLDANHGQMMVSRSLGYLAAAKNGLTEDELLDVLSLDKDVISDFLHRSPKSPAVESLPVVVWSRLCFDLRPYLTERTADGTSLMAFYHPQFGKVVTEEFLAGEVKKERHRGLTEYFHPQDDWCESLEGQRKRAKTLPPTPRPANVRKVDELPWQRLQARQWNELGRLLTDLSFLEAKVEAGMVFDLASDYKEAVKVLEADQPQRRILRLLEEAIRRDIHFIARHPTTLFQCMWNTCWWYDCDDALSHYDVQSHESPSQMRQRRHKGRRICSLMEMWRSDRSKRGLTPPWLRSMRPPISRLGSGLTQFLRGHSGAVLALSFSPDSRRLVSGGEDETVRVWDIDIGNEVLCLQTHMGEIVKVAFSLDGTCIVSRSQDGVTRSWRISDGRQVKGLPPESWRKEDRIKKKLRTRCPKWIRGESHGQVVTFALSPDSALAAVTWYSNSPIEVQDTKRGDLIACFRGHEHMVTSMAFSRDGRYLVSGSRDETVRVWNVTSEVERNGIGVLDFAAHHKKAKDTKHAVLQVFEGHQGPVQAVAFAPDGVTLASAGDDGAIAIWLLDRTAMQQSYRLRDHDHFFAGGHSNHTLFAAFIEDGRYALSWDPFGTSIKGIIWDVMTGLPIAHLQERGQLADFSVPKFSDLSARFVLKSSTQVRASLGDNYLAQLEKACWEALKPKQQEPDGGSGVLPHSGYDETAWQDEIETTIISVATGQTIGWFPVRLETVVKSPSSPTWFGAWRTYPYIFALEGAEYSVAENSDDRETGR